MVTLTEFRENATAHGICDMAQQWDAAQNKRQLMDLALSAKGMPYVARAIAEGWGPSVDYIRTELANFNASRFIHHGDGYSAAFYCSEREVFSHTTATLVIDCQGEIVVNRLCALHIVNSKVKITGDARAIVYLYNSEITNADTAKVIVKEDNNV
jgi:hypothetical protein